LSEAEKAKIKGTIGSAKKGLDSILGQTSKVLGEITSQLGISVGPRFDEGILTKIDLIPVAEGKILVIVAVKSGLARTILLEVESNIEIEELHQIEQILNERLIGLTLGHIRKTLKERLSDANGSPRLIKLFIDSKSPVWSDQGEEKLHFVGTDKLITQPEFADRDKLTEFVKLLEEQKALIDYIEAKAVGEGIVITIGSENEINQIQGCSLVISRYNAGKLSGTIGIIGPTRMPYSKLVSIVEYTAKSLTDALSDL